MKRIIVVSDTHYDSKSLTKIVNMYPKASLYLHAGDSQLDEYSIRPFISVKGNNDYLISDEVRIIDLGVNKIYMTHGHKNYLSEDSLSLLAKRNECNILIFGHTHRPFYKIVDGVHILNPGSLSLSRSTLGNTYATIEIDENNEINIEIKQF